MEHMRRDEMVEELTGYQHTIRLGFASVTVGDVVHLISENAGHEDTIERLTKQIDRMMTIYADDQAMIRLRDEVVKELEQERDAARAEVEQQRKYIGGLEYHLDAARAR